MTELAMTQPNGNAGMQVMPKGESPIMQSYETSTTSAATLARARVEARYVIARANPRDWDDVRARLLKDCRRPGFAASARYRKPVGKGIEGLSIRFAEAAIRHMGNLEIQMPSLYDDERKRIVSVLISDLETNTNYSKDITVEKTIERNVLKEGQASLGARTNSQGRMTYLVAATDDDLLNKEGALTSKALRTMALRLLPSDIKEECERAIIATIENEVSADPDAAKKALVDAYATLGVLPSDLKNYLGRELEQLTPKDVADLRGTYAAIRDNETTWVATVEARDLERKEAGEASKTSTPSEGGRAARVKDAVKSKAAESKSATTEKIDAETGEVTTAAAPREPGSDDR